MTQRPRVGNCVNSAAVAPNQTTIGGLQAYATLPGADWEYGIENQTTSTRPLIGALSIDPKVSVGVGRLVGLGIEVINATAPLYDGGTVFCWRAPEPVTQPETFFLQNAAGTAAPFTGQVFRYPPQNIAQAQLYTGTESWKAKHGAYMVATFTDFENPARIVSYGQPVLIRSQETEDSTYNLPGDGTAIVEPPVVNETDLWVPNFVPGVIVPTKFGFPGNKLYPINSMGMIFSGLQREAALTLKMTYYYESLPSLAQPEILTLAHPTTRYDAIVLKLLAEAMRSLPVAVMSKENAEGDWWDRVLQAVQMVAPGVMAMIPGGEVLSPGVFAAITSLRSYRNETNKRLASV